MAKKAYVGVSSKARKTKKIYIGVSGKARKVKKGYIGVNGKARLFFTGQLELVKKSNAISLSVARRDIGGASNDNYALFAGGYGGDGSGTVQVNIDAYNASLTRSLTYMDYYAEGVGGGTIGNVALLIGGYNRTPYKYFSTVDNSLVFTRVFTSGTGNSDVKTVKLANYLIMTACASTDFTNSKWFSAVDNAMTFRNINTSSIEYYGANHKFLYGGGALLNNKAVFIGGYNGSNQATVIDNSLTMQTVKISDDWLSSTAVANTNNYAIVYTRQSSKIRAYNASYTETQVGPSAYTRTFTSPLSASGLAIFAGGDSNVVEYLDDSLTLRTASNLSNIAGNGPTGATIGQYVLFAGGYSSGYIATTNVYQLS